MPNEDVGTAPVSNKRIFVYGAGGHGKVVADILLASGKAVVTGFVDDDPALQGAQVLGLPVVGNDDWLRAQAHAGPIAVALGIGANQARRKVAESCQAAGIEILTPIHPAATVARSVKLGRGTVVMAEAVLNADARVGLGVIVNTGAVVEHDVVIGDYAHLSPNSAMGGASSMGELSHLGLGASVLPGIKIGSGATVGAGAVVTRNVPNRVVVVGVPARLLQKGAPAT